MKKDLLTQRDQVLALLIFILWSMNLIIPSPVRIADAPSFMWLPAIYLLLHVAIFVYCGFILLSIIGIAKHKHRRTPRGVWWRVVLYAYALSALGFSMYLLAGSLF